jgi:hypothetical protein
VTDEEKTVVIDINRETAITFAADGMLDAYEIAKEAGDTETMLKISTMWMGIAKYLDGYVEAEEVKPGDGTGHYL